MWHYFPNGKTVNTPAWESREKRRRFLEKGLAEKQEENEERAWREWLVANGRQTSKIVKHQGVEYTRVGDARWDNEY